VDNKVAALRGKVERLTQEIRGKEEELSKWPEIEAAREALARGLDKNPSVVYRREEEAGLILVILRLPAGLGGADEL
jgi:hypothetical protein